MPGYYSQVGKDIRRWRDAGMIDGEQAERLLADIAAHRRAGFSIGSVLAMFGAALLAAAILILVAANWEAFPRIARVAMIFLLIAGGYVGGALLRLRGAEALGEGAMVVGAASFGAGIALVGQMYHLSGDEAQAILLWCGGTALAALLTRSGALNLFAVLILGFWLLSSNLAIWRDAPVGHLTWWLGVAALWALSIWTGSRGTRHLLLLATILYASLSFLQAETIAIPLLLALAGTALFAAAWRMPDQLERLAGIGGEGGMMHGVLFFLAGMTLTQFYLHDDPGLVLAAILSLAGIIAAIAIGGGDNRWLRWLCYAAFASQICYLYAVTLGTMLGAAGFFLVGGMVLVVMAVLIRRLEPRLAARAATPGGE